MLPRQVGGERGGQPRKFVPPTNPGCFGCFARAWDGFVFPLRDACCALLAFSCLLNQQSNTQCFRATLSGSTLLGKKDLASLYEGESLHHSTCANLWFLLRMAALYTMDA